MYEHSKYLLGGGGGYSTVVLICPRGHRYPLVRGQLEKNVLSVLNIYVFIAH
jgi:hypothetical protein